MTPDIFRLVGDFRGDSLQLAREAAEVDADIIVQAGVHFMAETSKILAPSKTVLISSLEAGCSLASSITGADVRLIKERYPDYPVVTYVNTTADVKAECHITCTSSNAAQVVEAVAKEWDTDTVILVPDQYLATNVAAQTNIRVITWPGACEVHELFSADDVECAHGNTSGALDEDQLFYLRARGIPEPQARALLTEAFIAEALEDAHESVLEAMLETARAFLAAV